MKRMAMAVCAVASIVLIQAQQSTKTLFQVSGQQPNVSCASDLIHQRMLVEDDDYRQSYEMQEEAMLRYESEYVGGSRGSVVTIPVVVHVIHTGEAQGVGSNISDAQIQSAIDGLTEDFRKMAGTNGDGGGVDVEMEFCLASRDPNDNPTNGIVRVDGSSVADYAQEGIGVGQGSGADNIAIKNLSRWDRSTYYNIWIVNEIEDNDGGSGIQGFAYFPNSSSTVDGAVILYNAFGTVGTLKSYTSMNRTATHEIGHAFYLYHTFQGGNCSETDCTNQGDRVCDTPPTTQSTSCNSPACSGTQQVENYMDYTSQSCQDMFTQGQKDRMWANLELYRSSLITSNGCVPPNSFDASISQIHSPGTFSCASTFSPSVQLTNYGSATLSNVDIKYRVDNGPTMTYSYSGSLGAAESAEITLPAISASSGQHTFYVYSENPNGQTDQYQSNDQTATPFEVVVGNEITVEITVDNSGGETSWDIKDDNGTVVASGGPYPSGIYGTVFEHDVCLPLDCYEFTIYDSDDDGIWGGAGFGSYSIMDDGGEVLVEYETPDFTSQRVEPFCLSASTASPTADFTANATSGCGATTFSFADQSSGTPTSWAWTFQGGSPSSSSQPNPSGITFSTSGPHDVTLTVTNANGSDSEFKNDYITIGSGPTLNASVSNTSCHDTDDGAINLTVNGGAAPYDYDWSNNSTSQDIMGLSAGTYTVSVTDDNGCESQGTYTVGSPAALTASTSTTNAGCDANGSASVSASGGTPQYTYSWNDQQSQTGSTATGLASGSYVVVVTDANGCQKTSAATVGSTGGVQINNISSTPSSCADDGTATVSASGGAQPYGYAWSNGQTTATITGLSSGQYSVTVTDANGCEASSSVSVGSAGGVDITNISSTPSSCADDGTATVSASGGAQPYGYAWSNGQTTATITSLSSGQYSVTVTDANGCEASSSVSVGSADGVEITNISSTPSSCADDGTATVSASGGAQPYGYSWSNGQTTATITGLSAGQYSVTVTDANGCEATSPVTVAGLPPLVVQDFSTNPATCANDGSATIFPSGGETPYEYLWSDEDLQTTATAIQLSAGDYTVVVTDANGCQGTQVVTVSGTADIVLSDRGSGDANCVDDGWCGIYPTGGTPPYSYQWDGVSSTSNEVHGLGEGTYFVTVTDANGCSGVAAFTISGAPAIDLGDASSTMASCTNDGTATVNPTGGTPPYQYLWNDPQAQTTATAYALLGGNYQVTVTDANGCTSSRLVIVGSSSTIDLSTISTSVSCHGLADGSATVTATGGTGNFTFLWNDPMAQTTATATGLLSGTYAVTVTDGSGCQAVSSIAVHEPDPIDVQFSVTQPSCSAYENGSIQVTIDGGTAPFDASWEDAPEEELDRDGITAGMYQLNVSDAAACTSTSYVMVSEPDDIQAQVISSIPDSCGLNTGEVVIGVTGGTGSHTVIWDDESQQHGMTLSHVRWGNYTAYIQDANACQKTKSVEVEEIDCNSATAITELDEALDFQLYPNPLSGNMVRLRFSETPTEEVGVALLDLNGKLMQEVVLSPYESEGAMQLDKAYATGMYIVRIQSGQKVHTKRLMIYR